ncbi:MAG TPA: formate dehydrogenase subunit delta [Candidatus Binataceae bacterium]|jgi:formate dehydrogenase subunit delta|nr:formate dehydrogenase subunit delta [Candidatus Binataceae bacterium]
MNIHHLVKMANQIGDFFAAYPDRDHVIGSIAQHLKNSWDPRMRRQIIEYVNQSGGVDLKALVREAVLDLSRSTEQLPAEVKEELGSEAPGDD